ncbi:pentapeptide repeat-containing protein [Pontibacter sp. MBLB2868]|uniref:pentapeptide repeat-containing protein n=1 Tax=Pontibacter sp. MBLB2868 TaxID=3451555 RepID=UPI003F752BEC
MNTTDTADSNFSGIDFTEKQLQKGAYENCTFSNCLFAHADLAGIAFIDCQFKNCDLSMANLQGTAFRDVAFEDCKLLGLHFEDCNNFLLSVSFKDCQLNLSSFFKLNLKGTQFTNCSLKEVDFNEANLTSALFSDCDLAEATFEFSVLVKSDLRTAYNYSIDPEKSQIRNAKFSLPEVLGLLSKYDIDIQ